VAPTKRADKRCKYKIYSIIIRVCQCGTQQDRNIAKNGTHHRKKCKEVLPKIIYLFRYYGWLKSMALTCYADNIRLEKIFLVKPQFHRRAAKTSILIPTYIESSRLISNPFLAIPPFTQHIDKKSLPYSRFDNPSLFLTACAIFCT